MHGHVFSRRWTMGDIILGGKKYPCRAPVLTWEQTGLEFKLGRGARRRTEEIDLFVFHWTGGENEPPQMFRTLEKRKLGVEFAITRAESTPGYGTIYQFCDPMQLDTFDAGYVNRVSMGCEIINYGWRNPKKLWMVPKAGKERETYQTVWNGRRVTYARFFAHQVHAALALADAVIESGVTKIEKRVPRLYRTMTPKELQEFHGVVGHNHVSSRKSDPGTDLLEMFIANGY